MKNILVFLTTFIVIMSVGIFVLYDRSTDKEAFKSQVKADVTTAVSTVVTEANDVKDKIKTNVEAQKENKASDSLTSSDNTEKGKNISTNNNDNSSSASTESSSEEIIIQRESKADPITKAIVTQAMNSYVKASKDSDVKDIFSSMSEEDRDIVADMIAENVSLSSISEIQEIISSGDDNALTTYAEKHLSEEDQKILAQIMKKYDK